MKTAFFALPIAALPFAASAQVIADCDWVANPANIAEPWEGNSRSYANGAIRIALLDTGGEPVCCSAHLLILAPSGRDQGEPEYRACHVFSARPGTGFFGIDVARTEASYDPARGLLLSVPVYHWTPEVEAGAAPIEDRAEIRINQATGVVSWE